MTINKKIRRYSPHVAFLVLITLLAACSEDTPPKNQSEDTHQSQSTEVKSTVDNSGNRFADIKYPNAITTNWSGPEEIYKETCAYCHSAHPGAGVGPVLLGRQLPSAYITLTVRHGRNGMPAFRESDFSKAELEALGEMIQNSSAPEQVGKP